MLFPPEPVVSGTPYQVMDVDGRSPGGLEDFVGAGRFTLDVGHRYLVCGAGHRTGDAVRFHEKTAGGAGKDVRVWLVTETPGGYEARHAAAC